MTTVRSLVRLLYAPTFFLGFNGLAIGVVVRGWGHAWLGALLVLAIGASLLAERVAPYERSWNHDHRDVGRDVVHACVNEVLNVAAVAVVPLASLLLPQLVVWPAHWPVVLQLLLAIVVADFGITMMHFASHRVRILWSLHAVHHSVRRLYGFNGLMKHPLHQMLEVAAGSAPLLFLGVPLEVASLLAFAAAVQLLLQHSNVDMRVGPLGCVWAVATGHRCHHIASKTEGDVNFGLFTLVWDHLLGTYRGGAPRLGSEDLGVAGEPDYPDAYGAQLWAPFVRSGSRSG